MSLFSPYKILPPSNEKSYKLLYIYIVCKLILKKSREEQKINILITLFIIIVLAIIIMFSAWP